MTDADIEKVIRRAWPAALWTPRPSTRAPLERPRRGRRHVARGASPGETEPPITKPPEGATAGPPQPSIEPGPFLAFRAHRGEERSPPHEEEPSQAASLSRNPPWIGGPHPRPCRRRERIDPLDVPDQLRR